MLRLLTATTIFPSPATSPWPLVTVNHVTEIKVVMEKFRMDLTRQAASSEALVLVVVDQASAVVLSIARENLRHPDAESRSLPPRPGIAVFSARRARVAGAAGRAVVLLSADRSSSARRLAGRSPGPRRQRCWFSGVAGRGSRLFEACSESADAVGRARPPSA